MYEDLDTLRKLSRKYRRESNTYTKNDATKESSKDLKCPIIQLSTLQISPS